MLAHNTKKRIFFNVLSLFLIAIISLFAGCGDIKYWPEHMFHASFKTNDELYEFYQIFKRQNPYQALSFDLDDNELFDTKSYNFYGGHFSSSDYISGNLYDYKYNTPSFKFLFSYDVNSNSQQELTKKEKIIVECKTNVWDGFDASISELVYTYDGIGYSHDREPDAPEIDILHKIYKYSAKFNNKIKVIAEIKIKFVNGSYNDTIENVDTILETLKQTIVILK